MIGCMVCALKYVDSQVFIISGILHSSDLNFPFVHSGDHYSQDSAAAPSTLGSASAALVGGAVDLRNHSGLIVSPGVFSSGLLRCSGAIGAKNTEATSPLSRKNDMVVEVSPRGAMQLLQIQAHSEKGRTFPSILMECLSYNSSRLVSGFTQDWSRFDFP